jgi:hypothetical protein
MGKNVFSWLGPQGSKGNNNIELAELRIKCQGMIMVIFASKSQ